MTTAIHHPTSKPLNATEHQPQPWPADSIALAATPTVLTCTSLLVRSVLRTWGLQAAFDPVEAIALQLVRSAVEATGIMTEHLDLKHVDHLNTIILGLRQAENAVVVEVWDSSSNPPTGASSRQPQIGIFHCRWRQGGVDCRALPCNGLSYVMTKAEVAFSASRRSADERVYELVRRHWTTVCMGLKENPAAIAAFHQDDHWADVLILRGADRAAAYRTLIRPDDNPLTVTHVI